MYGLVPGWYVAVPRRYGLVEGDDEAVPGENGAVQGHYEAVAAGYERSTARSSTVPIHDESEAGRVLVEVGCDSFVRGLSLRRSVSLFRVGHANDHDDSCLVCRGVGRGGKLGAGPEGRFGRARGGEGAEEDGTRALHLGSPTHLCRVEPLTSSIAKCAVPRSSPSSTCPTSKIATTFG